MATNFQESTLLKMLQHNYARSGQVMEAVLGTAVKWGVDLVLIRELRGENEKDRTCSHPSFKFIR
jgi:hypothetical protein